MDSQEILEMLKYGEHIRLECKKAESTLPNSVWETYSSFANTDGGVILLGVEEHVKETEFERRFSFVGVNNPTRRITEFWNTVNSDKVSANILVDADIGTCEIHNKTILWIRVPAADYRQRPVYLNGNPMKYTFKRNHEGDYHCTEADVRAMIRDASDSGNDGTLLVRYTMEDIDLNTLRSYRIEFEHQNPGHVWNSTDSFITDVVFDNIRMDYIDASNLFPGSRWSDRLTYDGSWENNLYNFMRQVMPKLVSELKRPFRLQGMVRIDDTPVHKAIREAVVNMMIHSDYLITGVLKIVKTDKGFLFSNPGNLKLPLRMIYEGGHSVARNPRIQTMFRMIGYGDNIGSGFPTILSAWGEENWRKPDLSQNDELHLVELKLWMISMMPAESTEALRALFGWVYARLDSPLQIILSTAYLEKTVTNSRMQSILELNSLQIGRLLSELVEKNLLVASNRGRWTSYQLNTDFEIPPEQMELTNELPKKMVFKNETDRAIYEYIETNGFITSPQILHITKITTTQGANAALGRLMRAGLIEKIRKGRQFIYRFKTQ